MRSAIRVLLVLSTSLLLVSTAAALEFVAVADGGWKDPATWGRTGFVRDGNIPGFVAGRLDIVIIPAGITVAFEGDYLDDGAKSGGNIEDIDVFGHVTGKKGSGKIRLRTNGDITVLPGGMVGDTLSSAPKRRIFIKADSNVTVGGIVNSPKREVEIEAGKDIKVEGGGKVASGRRKVKLTAKKGKVEIAEGGSVAAGDSNTKAHVWINAGKNKPVNIKGSVFAGKDVHIGTLTGRSVVGNVLVDSLGSVVAMGEVIIRADTLRVRGKIRGHTVQKTCKVLIIEGKGEIVQTARPLSRITNKAYDKWLAEKRRKQEAAERAERIKSAIPDFSIADMSGVDGTVLEADALVRVAGGIGSTLDLTGNPPGTPVIVCPGEIEIFVDNILLDPGVLVEDLCGPGPVMLGPGGPTFTPTCIAAGDTVAYPGVPGELKFRVTNMGFDLELYEIILDDPLGWGIPPTLPPVEISGAFGEDDSLITIPFDPPPWAIPDVDTNKVTLTVRSLSDPLEEYSETHILAVADLAELKAVHAGLWGVNPAPGGAVMGVEHWLTNNGDLDDTYVVSVWNAEGWPMPPLPPDVLIPAGEEFLLMSEMEIPPGTPDGFPNEVYLTVESVTSPGVAYTDTIGILVNVVADTGPDLPPVGGIRHEAHPNPFNPRVTIAFSLPAPGDRAVVTVYDVDGRRVRRVFEGPVGPAGGTCVWDGTDAAGRRVSSGVYVYRIETGGLTATGKVVLAK